MSKSSDRWRISPLARLWPTASERLLVTTDESAHIVSGDDAAVLLALEQPRDETWIVKRFGPAAMEQVSRLHATRFVEPDDPDRAPSERAYALATRLDARGRRVSLMTLTDLGGSFLEEALSASGVLVSDDAPVLVVVADDYLQPGIPAIAARETRPWLLARPVGVTILVGPVVRPAASTCWSCLAHWLSARRWLQAAMLGHESDVYLPQPAVAASPASLAIAGGVIAMAAARLAAEPEGPFLLGSVLAVDTHALTSLSIPIPARLRCRCQGQRSIRATRAVLTNDLTGIASRVHVTDAPVAGLYHASCHQFLPRSQRGSRRMPTPGSAFGKGRSADAALDGCLGEAVERYSIVWQGTEPMVRGRLTDLPNAIAPESILLYSERQYALRDSWNAASRDLFKVPRRLDEAQAILWSPVWSLVDGGCRLVPTSLCYGGVCGDPLEFCVADSIGCAAGRTQVEAVLSALLEVVERDALAIWWYNRLQRPGLALSRVQHDDIAALSEAARAAGLELTVLDITHDLDIPVYVAVGTDGAGARPFLGCAAHPDASVAVHKAIAELIQLWFWTSQCAPEPALDDWLRAGNIAADAHLVGDSLIDLRRCYVGSPTEMLSWCVQQLAARHLEPFTVDLTRPEAEWPVSRVIVPGVRHCWHRLAPGRLYDVPVTMGWSDRRREEELNPTPCPL